MSPAFRIFLKNREISDKIEDRLLSLRITDELDQQADTLEITLDDQDFDIAWPRIGVTLEVWLGIDRERLANVGIYVIDEVGIQGPPSVMTIRGKATDMRQSMKASRSQSWSSVTLKDINEVIANRHGLQAKVSDALASIEYEHIDQTDESDLHFLTRLAKNHDATVKVANGFITFVPKGQGKSASGRVLPVIEIFKHDILRFRMNQSERQKYQSVKMFWENKDSAEIHPVVEGDGSPVYTDRHPFLNETLAASAARSKYQELQRGVGTLSLSLEGRSDLSAGMRIDVKDMRTPINGEWNIRRVEHTWSNSGFVTRLECDITI